MASSLLLPIATNPSFVPSETHHKHLSDKLGHVQRNTSRLIEGNDTSFENRLKTLNFPTSYLSKDYPGFAQLLQFIKSDFIANLEDYMSFNKREIRHRAIVKSVESSTVEPTLILKNTSWFRYTNCKNLHALIVECNAVYSTKKGLRILI